MRTFYIPHCLTVLVCLSLGVNMQEPDFCYITDVTNGGVRYDTEKWIYVSENETNGSFIGWLNITGDNSDVSLTYDESQNDFFSFDLVSRNLTLKKDLDVDNELNDIMTLVIQCLPRGDPSNVPFNLNVIVKVKDYNDNTPTFVPDTSAITIPEDTEIGTTLVTGLTATDADRTGRIYYKILPGAFSEFFSINAESRPDITVAQTLDFEATQQMTIEIEARDVPEISGDDTGPQRSSTATLIIDILDSDDFSPEFSSNFYNGVIKEDADLFTIVNVTPPIQAVDPDTLNTSITYSLLDRFELFEIDALTGVVRNEKNIYDDVRTVSVLIQATQVDNYLRKGFALLTIQVIAANISAPKFQKRIYHVNVTELFPVDSILLRTYATDVDFGSSLQYLIVEEFDDLSIDNSGNIRLQKALDYELERKRVFHVTASDGTYTSTTTVSVSIVDANDNNPELVSLDSDGDGFVYAARKKGDIVASFKATDRDRDQKVQFSLGRYKDLFSINSAGEVIIQADPELLLADSYPLLITATDDGTPARVNSTLITVVFLPKNETQPTPGAIVTMAGNDTLVYILGAVAGVLFVVVIILVVYIIWRQRRTREELNKARAPIGYAAKGLTYRQAEVPDDLPKMDLRYSGDTDETSEFEGSTTIQENPLTSVNQGYMQSSGSEMDRDVSEIEIATAVIPYDDEDYGYDGQSQYDSGHLTAFRGDDSTSSGSSQSDSTGGSRRGLVHDSKPATNQMTSWDSDDKIHPQGAQKLKHLDASPISQGMPPKQIKTKPQITVYF